MYRLTFAILAIAGAVEAQTLSTRWEELTAGDFVKAIRQSRGVCVLPFGVLEKHGPTGPLGTDLLNVRYNSLEASKIEYAVVFPEYYFGQIFEAKHQPGTIAYSSKLMLDLLQETASEMARNGCKKIVIINGHGGNTLMLQYFAQIQLESPRDYTIYALAGLGGPPGVSLPGPSKPGADGHGGEGEMSNLMAHRPDLVIASRGGQESGRDLKRVDLPTGVYTGIWWYSSFPNHYAGDATGANAARGQVVTRAAIERIANILRAVKADEIAPRLQREFYERSSKPLETPQ
ncbi:MAG: creatininase family protein [Acidobacteria bacterium]|nr:creatininase family protein [Acidobacteriota bacterium]